MKKLAFFVLFFLMSVSLVCAGQTWVNGYCRSNGTYVQGHWRTTPDRYRTNNYSYPGNYNPNKRAYTPQSSSPAKLYPTNPNPYNQYRSGNGRNSTYSNPYNNQRYFNNSLYGN